MKPIRPLFKWFGSSWSSAKHYPKPLENLEIFEPFAGSAGYSLNYHWYPVTIFDTNKNVADLWQWLIKEATSQDVLDIPLDVPVGTDIRTLGLNRGQELLLKHWQRTNNYGECWTISPWGDKPGQWVKSCRDRIAEQIHAVKHWKFEPITWNKVGTYLNDPPYFYNYRYGVKDFDYVQYAQNVINIPQESLVICCEAVCPKTQAVPNYLPFEFSHRQVTSRRKAGNNVHSKELVYIRKPLTSDT